MKKWDYRVESLSTTNFNDEKSVKEMKEILLQIGSEGWELVGIVPTFKEKAGFAQNQYVLKKCLLIFKKEVE